MKTAFVTGGSRGIGRAVVERLCELGYAVAFTYLHSEEAAKEVEKKTGAVAILADSAKESDVLAATKRAKELFSHIDLLVNNAAISSFSLFTDITTEIWDRTIAVDLTAAFLYSREFLPDMIRRKSGRIINITSMWGLVGAACEVHYSTAKAGLIGMTKALAKEVGPSGVTVNAIAPGVIDTDMNRALSEDERKALADDTPLCRLGLPTEIADAVEYLASEKASFITGEVLNVSGGYVI